MPKNLNNLWKYRFMFLYLIWVLLINTSNALFKKGQWQALFWYNCWEQILAYLWINFNGLTCVFLLLCQTRYSRALKWEQISGEPVSVYIQWNAVEYKFLNFLSLVSKNLLKQWSAEIRASHLRSYFGNVGSQLAEIWTTIYLWIYNIFRIFFH